MASFISSMTFFGLNENTSELNHQVENSIGVGVVDLDMRSYVKRQIATPTLCNNTCLHLRLLAHLKVSRVNYFQSNFATDFSFLWGIIEHNGARVIFATIMAQRWDSSMGRSSNIHQTINLCPFPRRLFFAKSAVYCSVKSRTWQKYSEIN